MNKHFDLKEYKTTNFEKRLTGIQVDYNMPFLPLIHKTDSVRQKERDNPIAFDYFLSGEIKPVSCNVFGENLVYTFIGCASYRELVKPVCFVIKPEEELIQNIFIFDSGAYFDNRYKEVVDNKLDINLFRLPPDKEMIKKFISLYFGDNTFYYFGLAKELSSNTQSIEEFDYAVLKRIVSFNKVHFDTRCRTLENVLRTSIPLKKYLMAIILPQSIKENKVFETFCKKADYSFDILYYDDNDSNAEKKTHNQQVDYVLLHYFIEKGFILI